MARFSQEHHGIKFWWKLPSNLSRNSYNIKNGTFLAAIFWMTNLFCRIFKRPNKTKKCIRLPTSDVLGANEAKNNKKPNEAVKFHLLGHSKVFSRWNWNLPVFRPTENLTSHGATIFGCFLMLFDTFWCYIVFVSFEPKADSQKGSECYEILMHPSSYLFSCQNSLLHRHKFLQHIFFLDTLCCFQRIALLADNWNPNRQFSIWSNLEHLHSIFDYSPRQ